MADINIRRMYPDESREKSLKFLLLSRARLLMLRCPKGSPKRISLNAFVESCEIARDENRDFSLIFLDQQGKSQVRTIEKGLFTFYSRQKPHDKPGGDDVLATNLSLADQFLASLFGELDSNFRKIEKRSFPGDTILNALFWRSLGSRSQYLIPGLLLLASSANAAAHLGLVASAFALIFLTKSSGPVGAIRAYLLLPLIAVSTSFFLVSIFEVQTSAHFSTSLLGLVGLALETAKRGEYVFSQILCGIGLALSGLNILLHPSSSLYILLGVMFALLLSKVSSVKFNVLASRLVFAVALVQASRFVVDLTPNLFLTIACLVICATFAVFVGGARYEYRAGWTLLLTVQVVSNVYSLTWGVLI